MHGSIYWFIKILNHHHREEPTIWYVSLSRKSFALNILTCHHYFGRMLFTMTVEWVFWQMKKRNLMCWNQYLCCIVMWINVKFCCMLNVACDGLVLECMVVFLGRYCCVYKTQVRNQNDGLILDFVDGGHTWLSIKCDWEAPSRPMSHYHYICTPSPVSIVWNWSL